jgi:hypothetical protein
MTPASAPVVTPARLAQQEVVEVSTRRRRNPGLFAGGLVMAVTGGVATTVGATMLMTGGGGCVTYCGDGPRKENVGLETAGGVVLLLGLAMIGIGVPLAVAGGKFDQAAPAPRAMLVPVVGSRTAGTALQIVF